MPPKCAQSIRGAPEKRRGFGMRNRTEVSILGNIRSRMCRRAVTSHHPSTKAHFVRVGLRVATYTHTYYIALSGTVDGVFWYFFAHLMYRSLKYNFLCWNFSISPSFNIYIRRSAEHKEAARVMNVSGVDDLHGSCGRTMRAASQTRLTRLLVLDPFDILETLIYRKRPGMVEYDLR